jgi:hypothetical protein
MVEESQQTIDFLSNLEDFFLYDDQSRWKAIGWTIGIAGSLGTFDFVFLGASVNDTTFLMGAIVLLMSFTWIAWYCSFRRPRSKEVSLISRRSLVFQLATFIAFLASFRLPRAEARTIERRLQVVSENPSSPQNIQEAVRLITAAQAGGIRIAPSIVSNVGKRFLDTAENDPTESIAWSAAQAFVEYRSFINVDFQPHLGHQIDDPELTTYYHNQSLEGTDFPPMFVYGWGVPVAEAARLNKIGEIPQLGRRFGNSFIRIQGNHKNDSVVLDGIEMKNVVIRDTSVYYDGQSVILENVCFVNCNINLKQSANSAQLANALLKSPCVSFKAI